MELDESNHAHRDSGEREKLEKVYDEWVGRPE
jgi:hypothetical protein